MRQEMRWERHFVPFTGKLSLLILLGLFIGLVVSWQIVDGMIDYNRIDPREPFSARLVRKECVREAPFPVHRFHVCRCSDGRFFDYRVYKAEFEATRRATRCVCSSRGTARRSFPNTTSGKWRSAP